MLVIKRKFIFQEERARVAASVAFNESHARKGACTQKKKKKKKRVLADLYSRLGVFIFRRFPSSTAKRPLLFRRLHCTPPPLPRYADEKSPFHSWMNAAGGYTIEVAAYKRRQKAKPTMDREISSRIVSIAVGAQSNLSDVLPALRALYQDRSSCPLSLPPADHNGNPSIRHRYPSEYLHPREQRA